MSIVDDFRLPDPPEKPKDAGPDLEALRKDINRLLKVNWDGSDANKIKIHDRLDQLMPQTTREHGN